MKKKIIFFSEILIFCLVFFFSSRKLLQNIIDCDLSDDAFPFFTSRLVKVGGIPCRAMRVSFVGELGYELHIPWDKCLPIYRLIWREGKKHNLRHAGYRALYSLSAEKGKNLPSLFINK